jgi:hypothetical protein
MEHSSRKDISKYNLYGKLYNIPSRQKERNLKQLESCLENSCFREHILWKNKKV